MSENIHEAPFDVRRDDMLGWLVVGLSVLDGTQRNIHKMSPTDQRWASHKVQTQHNFLALQVELAELLQELSWKPWDETESFVAEFPQNQVIAEEFADVLAFLGHIVRILNDAYHISPGELAAAYRRKTEKNIDRFAKMRQKQEASEEN